MKFWSLLLVGLLLLGCNERATELAQNTSEQVALEVPEMEVLKSTLVYKHEISLWTLGDAPFSGYAVSYYEDETLQEKFGILNGKKQNTSTQWFPDGHLKNTTQYYLGKLDGTKKMWSSDPAHVLIGHYNYDKGKAHGPQTKWYSTGELYKKLNLNRGKEEGLQQAYRKNGALYANYEAREGRIFGLKKASLCYGLEDEEVAYEK